MGGKVDFTIGPALTAFGRYGYRDVDIYDQPTIPLPSGGARHKLETPDCIRG